LDDTNKSHWDNENGFWSNNGCRLQRKDMPYACRIYDCKEYKWVIEEVLEEKKWPLRGAWKKPPDCNFNVIRKTATTQSAFQGDSKKHRRIIEKEWSVDKWITIASYDVPSEFDIECRSV